MGSSQRGLCALEGRRRDLSSYNNARLVPWFKFAGACFMTLIIARFSGTDPKVLDFLTEFVGAALVLATSYLVVETFTLAFRGLPQYLWTKLRVLRKVVQ